MTCKHDWHFIEGTERLRCVRCNTETGPRTYDQRVQDTLQDTTTMPLFDDWDVEWDNSTKPKETT